MARSSSDLAPPQVHAAVHRHVNIRVSSMNLGGAAPNFQTSEEVIAVYEKRLRYASMPADLPIEALRIISSFIGDKSAPVNQWCWDTRRNSWKFFIHFVWQPAPLWLRRQLYVEHGKRNRRVRPFALTACPTNIGPSIIDHG